MGIEQLENARIEGNVLTFDAELVRETSFSSQSLGRFHNKMTFNVVPAKAGYGYIEWEYEQDGLSGCWDEGYEEIGLSFNANKELIDYDGVFELPKEAVVLLEHLGYNCDYVKDE
jgi:hypothetical protein